MEIIRIEYDRINYQKQVFASNIKEMHFKNYDYYKTIYEASENGSFEAVWFLKDGKLAKSFSSCQYSNFDAMKDALNLKNEVLLNLPPMKQLRCKLGARI